VWATVAILVGPLAFVFAFVIPFFIANMILTAYILTNHTISPLTEVNDPLLNSLSVTTPRAIEILHLSFGYHVEHHVFPAMSPRHARLVRDALRERWPDRYQSLPMSVALWRIFTSSRVYKDAWTLIDPRSGREFPTLAPRMPIVAHEAKPSPAS
jgi:fatty acid desaturase